MNRFEGKVAIVTGAGAGIGRATALRLASEGALVAVFDISQEGADETVRLIDQIGGRAAPFAADVSEKRSVEGSVRRLSTGWAYPSVWSTAPASLRSRLRLR